VKLFWLRGYGWISGRCKELAVLELAADIMEAAPWKGARGLPTSMLRPSRLKWGQHDTSRDEECRDGRSGVVWRQRSAGSTTAGKPYTEGFSIMSVSRGPNKDLATVTMPYPTVTHYRHAHLILESTSPGQRGGSLSKQGYSADARSVSGRHGR
jgi:hypothetical protein